jgi:hypothetical protein
MMIGRESSVSTIAASIRIIFHAGGAIPANYSFRRENPELLDAIRHHFKFNGAQMSTFFQTHKELGEKGIKGYFCFDTVD